MRGSIDRTLALIKAGQSEQAFEEAKAGYLSHFELVEIPLRVADNSLTIEAETKFAEIRALIRNSDPDGRDPRQDRRAARRHRRRRAQAHPTGLGAPAVVFGQSFLIIFREGLEAVLLLSRAARLPRGGEGDAVPQADPRGRRHRGGRDRGHRAALPHGASPRCPSGREILEAVTALARGRGAVLRVVLAHRPARAEAVARVPEGARCGPRSRSARRSR